MESRAGESSVRDALEANVCSDAAVEFVVVFGSRATDDARHTSDLDVAIKFSDDLTPHDRFRKRCYFAGDLQRAAAPYVDVSDIEKLPIGVAHDAVSGEFYCGDEESFLQCKADIEQRYESERDALQRHQRAVIDRIATEGLRG